MSAEHMRWNAGDAEQDEADAQANYDRALWLTKREMWRERYQLDLRPALCAACGKVHADRCWRSLG
jgi:hypothetical protein